MILKFLGRCAQNLAKSLRKSCKSIFPLFSQAALAAFFQAAAFHVPFSKRSVFYFIMILFIDSNGH